MVIRNNDQVFMRSQLVSFFSGNFSLPMDVKSLPISVAEALEQKKLRDLAIKFLELKLSERK